MLEASLYFPHDHTPSSFPLKKTSILIFILITFLLIFTIFFSLKNVSEMNRILQYGHLMAGFSMILHFRESPVLFWAHVQVSTSNGYIIRSGFFCVVRVSPNMGNTHFHCLPKWSVQILYPVKL